MEADKTTSDYQLKELMKDVCERLSLLEGALSDIGKLLNKLDNKAMHEWTQILREDAENP